MLQAVLGGATPYVTDGQCKSVRGVRRLGWGVQSPHTRAHGGDLGPVGAPLPRPLFDKMLAAKNFQSGLQTLRHVEYSLHDMHLHYDYDPRGEKSVQDVIDEVRAKFSVMPPPAYNRFPNNFSHIFAGGYAAGYYSYKWAEVLSADAFSAFEETRGHSGVLDGATGARFRDEVLAVGGSRSAAESFRAFRGRDPQVDALLRHNGMIPA